MALFPGAPAGVVAVPGAAGAVHGTQSTKPNLPVRLSCGLGSRGSVHERQLVAARMREGKAAKKARVEKVASKAMESKLLELQCPEHNSNQFVRKLGAKKLLDIGFWTQHGSRALALKFDVTTAWIRVARTVVAAAYLNVQLVILGCLVARAAIEQPSFFGFRLAWDETGQRLSARNEDGVQRSVWNVLVSRLRLIIAWGDECYSFTLAFPPILVASVSASSVFNGLFLHVTAARMWRAINYLIQRAQFTLSLCETDAAVANQKLGAVIFSTSAENQCHLHWFCSLHQAQLDEVLVTAALFVFKLIPRMYSLSLLLQNGGFFYRLKGFHLRSVVRSGLVLDRGQPPLDAREYIQEITQYMMISHYHRSATTEVGQHQSNEEEDLGEVSTSEFGNICFLLFLLIFIEMCAEEMMISDVAFPTKESEASAKSCGNSHDSVHRPGG